MPEMLSPVQQLVIAIHSREFSKRLVITVATSAIPQLQLPHTNTMCAIVKAVA
jgi:hypothetical protein